MICMTLRKLAHQIKYLQNLRFWLLRFFKFLKPKNLGFSTNFLALNANTKQFNIFAVVSLFLLRDAELASASSVCILANSRFTAISSTTISCLHLPSSPLSKFSWRFRSAFFLLLLNPTSWCNKCFLFFIQVTFFTFFNGFVFFSAFLI